MPKIRPVLISIDSLVEVLKGYLGSDQLPETAKAVTLRQNPKFKNKLALEVESPEIKGDAAMEVKFDIRRYV
jgi:hypothetical protein